MYVVVVDSFLIFIPEFLCVFGNRSPQQAARPCIRKSISASSFTLRLRERDGLGETQHRIHRKSENRSFSNYPFATRLRTMRNDGLSNSTPGVVGQTVEKLTESCSLYSQPVFENRPLRSRKSNVEGRIVFEHQKNKRYSLGTSSL